MSFRNGYSTLRHWRHCPTRIVPSFRGGRTRDLTDGLWTGHCVAGVNERRGNLRKNGGLR